MVADAAASSIERYDAPVRARGEDSGWWLVLGLAVVLLILLGFAYSYLGYNRMDAICSTDAAIPIDALPGSVEYSWSWMPFGYTCTWGDISVTKFWW